MLQRKFLILQNINTYKFGEYSFLIGIFFLCSTLFISGLFLLPSLIIGSALQIKKSNYFKNIWQCSFLICGVLIFLSALLQRFVLPNLYPEIWDPNLAIIGTANWIPLFWIFWACQPFLDSPKKRKKFSYFLVAGTVPLLLTGFSQYFFDVHGPFKTLNGLIIWYQRDIYVWDQPGAKRGITGLFSNQNYAGSWLNLVLPFCITFILDKTQNFIQRSFSIGFTIAVSFSLFLTYSRNAWIGLILTFPLFLGPQGIAYLFISGLLFIFLLSPIFSGELKNLILDILPNKIANQLSSSGYKGLDSTRLDLLYSDLSLIKVRPLLGIGAASFTILYELETNLYRGHSHNLFTELAISYGLPVTIIFAFSVITLLIFSYITIFLRKKIDRNLNLVDRSFWVAVCFFFISQLVDIQYFEGRISILIWIFMGSLKNIIDEGRKNILNSNQTQ